MLSAHDCLEEIERLADEKSSEKRREMLRKVTDLFLATEDQQKEADTAIFGTVISQIAYELEVEARQELSERLVTAKREPHDLMVRLANDEISVAAPVLQHSKSLTDDDLVEIAKVHSQDHLAAISDRTTLNPAVTDVLVERGDNTVLQKVASNSGAVFSKTGMRSLSDRSVGDKKIFDALAVRKDVSPELIEAIKDKVAKKLSEEASQAGSELSKEDIDLVIASKAEEIDLKAANSNRKKNAIAAQFERGQLGEDDIVNFARARRVDDCILSVSLLSEMSRDIVKHCILEADLAALGILCKASGFAQSTFAALLQLRLLIQGLPSQIALTEMKRYQNLTQDSAQRVLRFLKVRLAASC